MYKIVKSPESASKKGDDPATKLSANGKSINIRLSFADSLVAGSGRESEMKQCSSGSLLKWEPAQVGACSSGSLLKWEPCSSRSLLK
jgi:hypothetical protein